jgi:cytochrome c biogenesis protein CcdA
VSVNIFRHTTRGYNSRPSVFSLVVGVLLIMMALGIPLSIFGLLFHLFDFLFGVVIFIVGVYFVARYFYSRKKDNLADEKVEVFSKNGEKFYMSVVIDEDGNPKADIKRVD